MLFRSAAVVNQQDAQDPAWQQAPVIFYEEEFNDLRLMRQASTVRSPVVTDWVAFRQAPRDNWRKEFLDATRFAFSRLQRSSRLGDRAGLKAGMADPLSASMIPAERLRQRSSRWQQH